MVRTLAAGSTLLALSACLHTSTPVADLGTLQRDVPLDARIWASNVGHRELSIRLNAPAHVAVFEIVPGAGTSLLYPSVGQPSYLAAGSHHPMVSGYGVLSRSAAHRASFRSGYDIEYGTRRVAWTQPRQIFLIASVEPLRLDALGASYGGRSVLLSHVTFASFSSQAIMGSLLDVVLPRQGRGEWVTDVHTIWPDPTPEPGTIWEERRTVRPFWLVCGAETFLVPAGTPFRILQQYFSRGCNVAASPEGQPQPQPPAPPDTGAAKPADSLRIMPPDIRGMKPRDTLAMPVPARRAVPGGPGLVHRIADREGLDTSGREAEARARALARAQGRSTGIQREELRSTRSATDARTPRGQDTRVAERIQPANPGIGAAERAERTTQPATRTPPQRDPMTVPRSTPGQVAGQPAGERLTPRAQERGRPSEPAARTAPPQRVEPAARARTNPPVPQREARPAPVPQPKATQPPPRQEPPVAVPAREPVKPVEPPKVEKKEPPPR